MALCFCSRMLAVAEEHEVRHFVYAARRNGALRHRDVAHLALLHGGEAGKVPGRCGLVARNALQLQQRVLVMIKGLWIAGS